MDCKKAYLTTLKAFGQAIRILITAQCECEERLISSPEAELVVVPLPMEKDRGAD